MQLKTLRRLIDRLDHANDDKVVMISTAGGDWDFDERATPVSTNTHVFLFVDPAQKEPRK